MTDKAKNQNAIEELIVGHFDGGLTEQQETELAAALAASASSKQLFLSYMRMEGRLHSLGRDGFLREPAVEPEGIIQQPADIRPVDQSSNQHSPSMRSRFLAVSTSMAVCAAMILMLASGLWPSRVNASSVLEKAQQAATEMVDRTSRLLLSDPDADGGSVPQKITINVRSGGGFVIRPDDGSYVMGSDGSDYWLVRPNAPVWVTRDFRSLAPELKRQIPNRRLLGFVASPHELFLLEMSSLLSLIERSYDTELIASADSSVHHVRATRRPERPRSPPVIDFWAAADSGVVLRVEREWPGKRHASFQLIESPTLPDRWYHYSKHAPDRPVQRLEAAMSE
ncbi:MAG: hypothetical protein P8J37_10015 [Fuerstiella sp.]|nr:hypothetical protein [Fuerstiella sp.]